MTALILGLLALSVLSLLAAMAFLYRWIVRSRVFPQLPKLWKTDRLRFGISSAAFVVFILAFVAVGMIGGGGQDPNDPTMPASKRPTGPSFEQPPAPPKPKQPLLAAGQDQGRARRPNPGGDLTASHGAAAPRNRAASPGVPVRIRTPWPPVQTSLRPRRPQPESLQPGAPARGPDRLVQRRSLRGRARPGNSGQAQPAVETAPEKAASQPPAPAPQVSKPEPAPKPEAQAGTQGKAQTQA